MSELFWIIGANAVYLAWMIIPACIKRWADDRKANLDYLRDAAIKCEAAGWSAKRLWWSGRLRRDPHIDLIHRGRNESWTLEFRR